jgi:hypothetical protein
MSGPADLEDVGGGSGICQHLKNLLLSVANMNQEFHQPEDGRRTEGVAQIMKLSLLDGTYLMATVTILINFAQPALRRT